MIDAITKYRESCNEIIALFCQKQGVEFSFWAGEGVEGCKLIAIGGCAFFNGALHLWLEDIIFDLESEQPKGQIIKWRNDELLQSQRISYRQFVNQQK